MCLMRTYLQYQELVSCFWLSMHSALVSWRAGCSLQQQHVSLGMHQQREQ